MIPGSMTVDEATKLADREMYKVKQQRNRQRLQACRRSAIERLPPFVTGFKRPILLKKSAMVSTVEKYALEIEIFTFGRGLRTQISRSSVQKRRFNQSMTRLFGRTDFFNRIGHLLPVVTGCNQVFAFNCQAIRVAEDDHRITSSG